MPDGRARQRAEAARQEARAQAPEARAQPPRRHRRRARHPAGALFEHAGPLAAAHQPPALRLDRGRGAVPGPGSRWAPTRCSSSSPGWSPRSSTWPPSRGRSCAPSGSPTTTTTTEDDDDGGGGGLDAPDLHARGRASSGARSWRRSRSALAFAFRTQIAEFLLNDPDQADAVVFATITGAVWAIFKLGEMVDLVRGPARSPTR